MTLGRSRQIDELAELYTLHPEFRDIFVEGSHHVHFFSWFLNKAKIKAPILYEISAVEVPSDILAKYNLPNNNRSKVIALAFEIETKLGENCKQVVCIADRDFDLVFNKQFSCTLLLFTDYTDCEMYSFNDNCLNKFLSLYIFRFTYSAKHILDSISRPLQELYLVRLANEFFKYGLKWMSFERCCNIDNGNVTFDLSDFVNRYLSKNSMLHIEQRFLSCIETLRTKLTSEPRFQIRGHDYTAIFSWYLKKHGVSQNLANKDAVCRTLCICIDYEQLLQEPLFKELLLRI